MYKTFILHARHYTHGFYIYDSILCFQEVFFFWGGGGILSLCMVYYSRVVFNQVMMAYSLRMGFTFLMDANMYFYNYFMGMKQTLISH